MGIPRCVVCGDATQILARENGYEIVVCATCDKYQIDEDVLAECRGGRQLDSVAMQIWVGARRLEGDDIPWITRGTAVWRTY